MKILVIGAGKMGSFFTDLLSFSHEVAVLESEPQRLRFIYNALRFTEYEQAKEFSPELVLNCVTLNRTIDAFKKIIPYVSKNCICQSGESPAGECNNHKGI